MQFIAVEIVRQFTSTFVQVSMIVMGFTSNMQVDMNS